MIQELAESTGNAVGYRVSGKLTHQDYRVFVPEIERLLEESGTIHLLLCLEDFHGWDLGAAWDDFKLGMKHRNNIPRLAIVGDRPWEEWMAKLVKPFMGGEVKYFQMPEFDDAWEWVRLGNS